MEQFFSGSGSAASAPNQQVLFFVGPVQGYLCFPEQHDATQTGQESSPRHTAFKGRKTSCCATMPCSASGPWACGNAVIRQKCPPAVYLPLCCGYGSLGGQPAPRDYYTSDTDKSPPDELVFSSGSRNTLSAQDKSPHAQGCSCGGEGCLSPGAVVGTCGQSLGLQ